MIRIIKRLPADRVTAAIAFLLLQVFCAIYLPYLAADMVNNGVVKGNIAHIWQQGGLMIALTMLGLVGQVLNPYISAKIAFNFASELRSDIYQKILSFSKNEFDKFGTATLITRNTNDVTQVQSLVETGLKFLIVSPLYLIGGIGMTYRLSPKLSLIFIAVIPFLTIGSVVIYKFANPLYGKMQKLLDRLNLFFREGLTGVKVIRAFRKEEEDFIKYLDTNGDYTKTAIAAGTIMSFFMPLITLLLNLTTIMIMWIGAGSIAAGTMEVGTIMAAISYSAQILLGFGILTSVILVIPRGQVSIQRIYEVLDMPLSIKDPEKPEVVRKGGLQFETVDFRYPGAKKKTLEDISFTVQEGQTLAIIGSTGDGKTSLVNLITRLYDVEKGVVKIGGIDIRKIRQEEVHDIVSFVPQKSTLFIGSIRENMLVAKPDATDEEIWAALEIACASEFVSNLENGLDSVVEKNGGNFSGGQKQRLCIARTLLKNAHIYIFDDSFSALDFKTDAAVRSSMKKKLSKAITVIVAQRVNTVMNADLVAVLDNGRLVGLGTHEKLLASNPIYKEIVNSQTYKEEIA
ncbi:ABC transporter ATP-binding protein [Clostridium aciditolerans]|uniref:ABC transporter ATP-binding protein n=1 Tax=Clostridium aciditolerans TaxID=339861 RepID=A0A934I2K9_9CLOT|nr:ABC transporter ATP-binding protein [Clostridium aciditolerans]MBI6874870.1 ABC transporter ATP-binding protein [Clostridium aciditolerans]